MAGRRQTSKGKTQDRARKALHPGKRVSAKGNTYTENRPNRSDKDRRKRV